MVVGADGEESGRCCGPYSEDGVRGRGPEAQSQPLAAGKGSALRGSQPADGFLSAPWRHSGQL